MVVGRIGNTTAMACQGDAINLDDKLLRVTKSDASRQMQWVADSSVFGVCLVSGNF